jgi:hypothetical protein
MTWDGNVSVSILSDPQAVTVANFGTPLHMTTAVESSFTERTREYGSSAEGAADSDLSAGAQAVVAAHFAQPLHTSTIKIGRKEADAAQVITWTITGTPVEDDIFSITVNGIPSPYTALSTPTPTSVATGLRALMTTNLAAEDVTVGGTGADITVTADNAGEPFTYGNLYTPISPPGTAGIDEVVTTANVNYATELTALLVEDSDWYGLTIESHTKTDILYTAAWMDSNNRFFMAQSAEAGVLTETADNVLEELKALNYARTAYVWHHADTEELSVAWVGFTLQADPDVGTTIWAYKTLSGITQKDPQITTTEQSAIESQYGNLYSTLGGVGATGMGILVDGRKIDTLISKDWYKARLTEEFQQYLLAVSNRNQKIPYTDKGLSTFVSKGEKINQKGVKAEHFEDGSTTATVPAVKDVPADKLARLVRVTMSAILTGAAELVTVTATVSLVGVS